MYANLFVPLLNPGVRRMPRSDTMPNEQWFGTVRGLSRDALQAINPLKSQGTHLPTRRGHMTERAIAGLI
jgi:hypothetical protein